jgi:ankyrin repeat protein
MEHAQSGASPLYVANYNGHQPCVRLLLDHGADTKTKLKVRSLDLRITAAVGAPQNSTVLPVVRRLANRQIFPRLPSAIRSALLVQTTPAVR